MKEDKLNPIHPGEVLLEEFIKPMNLEINQIASSLKVPTQQIHDLINGKKAITADLALRLAYFFKMSPHFWLGLQMDYDLDTVKDQVGKKLKEEITVFEN
ncbi:putative plasmid maintenance system antidote protein, XRE family [Halothece sp. PCC 7418]|uniref:HigA family addiction module antitoxin n=1 Tax=Halothece sp. (strain PCC 7418) TaxID=65093 RepID=UPI0002A06315|nr:HigA family addiction module antitoxin [Halothece sp. PCC 7418]AFZ45747.1 putative plasmid maintenance system antidote protein, XRE family [Halothece sp. PCC 7418]